MSRILSILMIALFSFVLSTHVLADEAAEIEKIKAVLTGEEQAEWAGDVEKIKSYFAPEFVMFGPTYESIFQEGFNNEMIDPIHYRIVAAGPDSVKTYAERYRTYPDYLKKNPQFQHSNVVEHVHVLGDMAIAVEKRVRTWNNETPREMVLHNMRNIWTLRKIRGEWKLTQCIIHISAGQTVYKLRPPR